MLELYDIKKDYAVAGETVQALKGISLKFRRSEFVSILGPSGCGKTTLLNIIGGLDKYTSGDLVIEGTSTKRYGDRDWDTYRNHSIGFIFQSYHLIPHQTILQNVELALMISGVSKQERRQRAIDALEKVGLKGKINNRPNQLSGGQAQRVAIARALINDPEIVLADEPTGALDSVTSVQIMELLKEISKDRLVIMVTHNPELAEQYSTRIVRLLDGGVVDDSKPYDGSEDGALPEKAVETPVAEIAVDDGGAQKRAKRGGRANKGSKKKTSMSIGMAMILSLKNLLSKSKRTAMVSVAGSIGIIGVSLVLAISSGVQGYIKTMEDDMLSGYPVAITQQTFDFTSLMSLSDVNVKDYVKDGKIHINSLLDTLGTFAGDFGKTNHIDDAYIGYVSEMPAEYVNLIQYEYGFNITNNLYVDFKVSEDDEAFRAHFDEGDYEESFKNERTMSVTAIRRMYQAVLSQVPEYSTFGSMISSVETFSEIPDNFDYIMSQYDVVAIDKDGEPVTEGYTTEEVKELFKSKDAMIMVLNHGKIDDLTLAQYGYFTQDEFLEYAYRGVGDKEKDKDKTEENPPSELVGAEGIPYSDFVGKNAKMKFTYYPNDLVYTLLSVPTLTQEEIADSLVKDSGFPQPQAAALAASIVSKRNESNEALKTYLENDVRAMLILNLSNIPNLPMEADKLADMMVANFYESYRTHGVDEQSYVANAYTEEYKIPKSDAVLQAFEDKPAYDESKNVNIGVKLILEKKEDISYGCLQSGFYYTNALTQYILGLESSSTVEDNIVNYINEYGELDSVALNQDYFYVKTEESGRRHYIHDYVPAKFALIETGATGMDDIINSVTGAESAKLGAVVFGGDDLPTGIKFFSIDFDAKNKVTEYLDEWNAMCESGKSVVKLQDGKYTFIKEFDAQSEIEDYESVKEQFEKSEWVTLKDGSQIKLFEKSMKITYTDAVGMIIGMVNTMIQMITIALVAFTALSLVVSTVMIGIITYVSVVERVKEIGILRAVGARKKDIKRLFNAETFIIGLVAGLFGILVTYLLSLIINIIVLTLAGIWGIAALPWWQALIMIAVSIVLTLISGLIPASAAAKKDPVVALRTE